MDNNFHIFPSETFIDLCLYQYGHEKCTPGHLFGPATRNHYLFHYVLSGTGTLMATNSKGQNVNYQVRSGQGFMIFPDVYKRQPERGTDLRGISVAQLCTSYIFFTLSLSINCVHICILILIPSLSFRISRNRLTTALPISCFGTRSVVDVYKRQCENGMFSVFH